MVEGGLREVEMDSESRLEEEVEMEVEKGGWSVLRTNSKSSLLWRPHLTRRGMSEGREKFRMMISSVNFDYFVRLFSFLDLFNITSSILTLVSTLICCEDSFEICECFELSRRRRRRRPKHFRDPRIRKDREFGSV
jgi:hypothetical protein